MTCRSESDPLERWRARETMIRQADHAVSRARGAWHAYAQAPSDATLGRLQTAMRVLAGAAHDYMAALTRDPDLGSHKVLTYVHAIRSRATRIAKDARHI